MTSDNINSKSYHVYSQNIQKMWEHWLTEDSWDNFEQFLSFVKTFVVPLLNEVINKNTNKDHEDSSVGYNSSTKSEQVPATCLLNTINIILWKKIIYRITSYRNNQDKLIRNNE